MLCPNCQHKESRVLESRSTEAKQSIRRRRECLNCKYRFTTYERIELVPVTIIKRDSSRESFDRSKLLRGILRACEKTQVSHQTIESIVDEIEATLQQGTSREFSSNEIGELVLKHLRNKSEVAYIRFASVYRKFQGIKDFVETLNQLQNNPLTSETNTCDDKDRQNANYNLVL
ncbi:MAG: transcriptional regulator NrdR [Xenococcaceae cyanobacterium MO_188.B19]|nr:transcriptional regulator NrdR [Xenococcaceae cyanobacterium MO_188.B19]MDJ0680466.1 transcriptional regulator NrdR [Xenococcaceae cyanobacterium MO_167.B52]